LVVERIVNLDPHRAYEELKRLLYQENCRVINEQPPNNIVEHGSSWWYFHPRDIKKKVTFTLYLYDSKTKIVATTVLSDAIVTGYLVGILIRLLFGVFFLINATWAEAIGGLVWAKFFWTLSILMFVLAILDIVSLIYYNERREVFAEEILRILP
jgi:hypothetical protein